MREAAWPLVGLVNAAVRPLEASLRKWLQRRALSKAANGLIERPQSPKSFRQPSTQITQFQRLNKNVGSRQNLPIAYD